MPSPSGTFKTKCPHCSASITARDDKEGKQVKCPRCESRFVVIRTINRKSNGRFSEGDFRDEAFSENSRAQKVNIERTVWVGSPIFWKVNFFPLCFLTAVLVFLWIIAFIVSDGIFVSLILMVTFFAGVLLLVGWYVCSSTNLEITEKRVTLKKGVLSKSTNEIRHSDVRNIQVSQGVFDRVFGIGTIRISSAAQSDIEIEASGVDNPAHVAGLIRERQN